MDRFAKFVFSRRFCLWWTAAYFAASAVAPYFDQEPAGFAMMVVGGPVLIAAAALGVAGIVGMLIGVLRYGLK